MSLFGGLCMVFGHLGFGVALLIVMAGVAATGVRLTVQRRRAAAFAAHTRSMTIAWTIPWLFVLLALSYGALFNH
jgi:hypothetical protein